MRSHTGAVLSLGQGALMSMSLKQKINTKSSTEAELVGVDDAMDFVEWIQLFVEQQLKSINEDSIIRKIGSDVVIQQDNTSTIQLENNGQASSTKRTRHINIRYFYVTSKIKEGSMRVIYHPTKQMISDYLTGFWLLPQYWGRILGSFFTGVYLPQKLVLSPPIERQYKPFQKHMPSY
jgi:hypothetical protein